MKEKLSKILLSLIVLLVLYGGSGINTVSFCCNECREGGISVILENDCCDMHKHVNSKHCHLASLSSSKHGQSKTTMLTHGQCTLSRVDVDWSETVSRIVVCQPIVMELLSDLYTHMLFMTQTIRGEKHSLSTIIPHLLSPRGYLSILSTLLI